MPFKQYPAAYESFLYEFHATRDYFECHELLEEYWKEHPGDPLGPTWVGLIQLAVGSYHHRRKNYRGALKMMRHCRQRLTSERLRELGLEGAALLALAEERIAALERMEPFEDIDLPFADQELLARVMQTAEKEGQRWGASSSMDDQLINRHTLRDRSGVIAAREAAAKAKKR
ncbi:DUF309 domain-containing protein [Paenibacillus montanisoli]|uniref:DUF309 domain-containing protein n=1 Tax=Paenibacillus montanisoli TaxID=2081970 RepID=UPI001F0CD9A4|nr:DUF309 domain-containing protein [Paenibacillus montanisoli]